MVPRETKTMLMQNLRGQTKSIMVFSKEAYYSECMGILPTLNRYKSFKV